VRVVGTALLEVAALSSFTVLWGACARQLALASSPADLPLLIAGLGLGFALADLVTGIAHWLCDRVFDEHAPFFGPLIVKGFREHHVDPLGITRHGFLGVNGNTALVAVPVLAAALAIPAPESGASGALLGWSLVIGLVFSAVATNQFHAWAHAKRVPRSIAWLQEHNLLLSPRAHAVHHDHGFDRAYCVTTGWWNPLLDRMQLFHKLETLFASRQRRTKAGNG
jgi:ubiquitin-conjugating enzyme E2 variant